MRLTAQVAFLILNCESVGTVVCLLKLYCRGDTEIDNLLYFVMLTHIKLLSGMQSKLRSSLIEQTVLYLSFAVTL